MRHISPCSNFQVPRSSRSAAAALKPVYPQSSPIHNVDHIVAVMNSYPDVEDVQASAIEALTCQANVHDTLRSQLSDFLDVIPGVLALMQRCIGSERIQTAACSFLRAVSAEINARGAMLKLGVAPALARTLGMGDFGCSAPVCGVVKDLCTVPEGRGVLTRLGMAALLMQESIRPDESCDHYLAHKNLVWLLSAATEEVRCHQVISS